MRMKMYKNAKKNFEKQRGTNRDFNYFADIDLEGVAVLLSPLIKCGAFQRLCVMLQLWEALQSFHHNLLWSVNLNILPNLTVQSWL